MSQDSNRSILCVGLDPDLKKIGAKTQFEFNQNIIDQTHDLVAAYKPNTAFYEADGARGIEQLKKTCDYINSNYPDVDIVLDAKRGDIGNTNRGYAQFAFDYLGAHMLTVQPYLGGEALEVFNDYPDKTIIVLARTSNPGAGEFQDLLVDGAPLYEKVAENILEWGPNYGVVAGATYPDELANIRTIVGNRLILVPGIGAQGGDLARTLEAASPTGEERTLISTSRAIIFGENPRQATEKLNQQIEEVING